jgi:phage terminase small subunit
MAGVKGKSGGARPGAGRPKKEVKGLVVGHTDDPLKFLLGVMNDAGQDPRTRVRAAIAAAQYTHTKKGDGGKKEERAEAAKKAGGGKFAPAAPPPLPRTTTVN